MPICIVLVGPAGSGKSCFVSKAGDPQNGLFNPVAEPTMGVEFKSFNDKDLQTTNNSSERSEKDTLRIWDTSGKPNYRSIATSYYGASQAAILMVDLSVFGKSTPSLQLEQAVHAEIYKKHIAQLKREVEAFRITRPDYVLYLVGTKRDLATQEKVLETAIENLNAFAIENNIPREHVFTTTAKGEAPLTVLTDNSQAASTPLSNLGRQNSPTNFVNNLSEQFFSPITILQTIYPALEKRFPEHLHNSAQEQLYDSDPGAYRTVSSFKTDKDYCPGWLSRFFGFFFGAIVGLCTALLVHNPVACFLAALRAPYFAEWGHFNWLRILLAPVVNPVMAVLYGLKDGAVFGAQNGVTELLQIPKNENFKLRTVIGSFLASILVAAAIVVALPILHLALPMVIGAAAGVAFINIIGNVAVDLYQTMNELSQVRKEAAKPSVADKPLADKPLPVATASIIPSPKHSSAKAAKKQQNKDSGYKLVNEYFQTKTHGSARSIFLVPPTPPQHSRFNDIRASQAGSNYLIASR